MGKLGPPFTAASVVNNIFRNYEHRWIYDFEEFTAAARHAAIPAAAIHRSGRMGSDLPQMFHDAGRLSSSSQDGRSRE